MRKQLLTTTAVMLLAFTGNAFAGMDEPKVAANLPARTATPVSKREVRKRLATNVAPAPTRPVKT